MLRSFINGGHSSPQTCHNVIKNRVFCLGQNPALSVLSFPYSFGGIPWGMYPAAAAAAAAAGLIQQVRSSYNKIIAYTVEAA